MKQKCKFKTCSAQIQSRNLRKINQASRDSVREKNKKSETAMTILQTNKPAKSVESDLNKINEEAGLEENLGEEEERIMISGRERIVESQVIITSSGNTPLTHGAQVTQVRAGTGPTLTDADYLPDPSSTKSEPKDLSFSVTPGPRGEAEDMRHSIDLEAGTQASEATVQNVLRSLKESDKTIINQILPSNMDMMGDMIPAQSLEQMMDPEAARLHSGLGDNPTQFYGVTLENSKTINSANSDHDYVQMKYSEGKVQIINIKSQVLLITCFSSS